MKHKSLQKMLDFGKMLQNKTQKKILTLFRLVFSHIIKTVRNKATNETDLISDTTDT